MAPQDYGVPAGAGDAPGETGTPTDAERERMRARILGALSEEPDPPPDEHGGRGPLPAELRAVTAGGPVSLGVG